MTQAALLDLVPELFTFFATWYLVTLIIAVSSSLAGSVISKTSTDNLILLCKISKNTMLIELMLPYSFNKASLNLQKLDVSND